jgi:hypothetical protein
MKSDGFFLGIATLPDPCVTNKMVTVTSALPLRTPNPNEFGDRMNQLNKGH